MSDKEEEEIHLRDQFAIAAMQALITKKGTFGDFIDGKADMGETHPRTERIARVAYIIADAMRKARLASFK